jgi:hypothetical protein
MNYIFWGIMGLLAFKTIIGFHFPWEKCSCCGKKWGIHRAKPISAGGEDEQAKD